MSLNMQCKICSIQLTEENARKRKGVVSGYRPQCKTCRNSEERRRYDAKERNCEYCDKLCRTKGTRSFCSTICRFKAYCVVDETTGCWIWRERWRRKGGYGIFVMGKKRRIASRVSYELFNGPLTNGLCVCHTCDNPPCVNPKHLWLGTNDENMIDMTQKGRQDCKLDPKQVMEIRKLYDDGCPLVKLCELYNMSSGAIRKLLLRKSWKHV